MFQIHQFFYALTLNTNILMEDTKPIIKIGEKGPLIIKGGATLIYPDGSEEIKEGTVALCRCGLSAKKPFCDGTHKEYKSW